jgi:hypothetical protein
VRVAAGEEIEQMLSKGVGHDSLSARRLLLDSR